MNTNNANFPMMRARFPYANIGTQSMPRFFTRRKYILIFVLQALAN
jgi:hypothetical protein